MTKEPLKKFDGGGKLEYTLDDDKKITSWELRLTVVMVFRDGITESETVEVSDLETLDMIIDDVRAGTYKLNGIYSINYENYMYTRIDGVSLIDFIKENLKG